MPEKTWFLWDDAVPRVPSVREHEFSQSDKSMFYEHVCLVTTNSGMGKQIVRLFERLRLAQELSLEDTAVCIAELLPRGLVEVRQQRRYEHVGSLADLV